MEQVVKVAKIGKSANSVDPNDFIFHSSYNTFKIILEGTKTVTLNDLTSNQTFTQAHNLSFIPTVSAFAIETPITGKINQVFLPNAVNINLFGVKLGWTSTGVKFNYVASDINNIIFNFDNDTADFIDVDIRYFVLEGI